MATTENVSNYETGTSNHEILSTENVSKIRKFQIQSNFLNNRSLKNGNNRKCFKITKQEHQITRFHQRKWSKNESESIQFNYLNREREIHCSIQSDVKVQDRKNVKKRTDRNESNRFVKKINFAFFSPFWATGWPLRPQSIGERENEQKQMKSAERHTNCSDLTCPVDKILEKKNPSNACGTHSILH